MSLASLERAIAPGTRILLDTTLLIAHLNGNEPVSGLATHVVDRLVATDRNAAIISMVTVMEVIVRPLSVSLTAYAHARDFLRRHHGFEVKAIDFDVATDAATYRVNHRMTTPDALIIATGQVHQVSLLVCNDKRWKEKLQPVSPRLGVVYLGDHV